MTQPEKTRRQNVNHPIATIVLLGLMIAAIVTVDVTMFRSSQWSLERLAANVGIVLIVGACYFRFLN
jgi:hypothetical protein